MLLKKIEIHGFKSFADKIEISTQPGITAIVGPNGSGKSNISDAVRWVLGEQSIKTLRGSRLEDVIFAGSTTRKAQGFAEVSITLDNTKNTLPIDYSEVTIARRVYRSGDSEFFINKNNCRLKDITELLLDTGIGRDGYSIIGQGRIDEILSAKSDERRQVFEEAAGIVKYKNRKQEAEKKLDNTEQNIVRINDILREIEKQLVPLEVQSHKAKAYLQYKDRATQLDINLITSNLENIKEKLVGFEREIATCLEEKIKKDADLEELEQSHSYIKQYLEHADIKLNQFQGEVYGIENNIEKNRGNIVLYNEKKNNSIQNTKRLKEEQEQFNNKIQSLRKTLDELLKDRFHNTETLKQMEKELNHKDIKFESINEEVIEIKDQIEKDKSDVIELMNEQSDKKSALNSLKGIVNNINNRLSQIDREKASINNEIDNITTRIEGLNKELEINTRNEEDTKKSLQSKLNEKSSIKQNQKELNFELSKLEKQINSFQSRLNVLEDMEKDFEGYSKSVKSILSMGQDQGRLKGIIGVIAQLIKVRKEYEVAIEIALGGGLQNIVTDREESAKAAIDYLKSSKLGRATFLPLTTVQSYGMSTQDEKICQGVNGFIGIASKLIDFESRFNNIFSNLLGRVVVVDKIETGFVLAKKLGYKYRIVSLSGEIISPGGSITGGSVNQRSSSILGRTREIEELKELIQNEKENLMLLQSKYDCIVNKIVEVEQEINELNQNLQELSVFKATLSNTVTQLKEEGGKWKNRIATLVDEIHTLRAQNDDAQKSMDIIGQSIVDCTNRQDILQQGILEKQQNLKDLSSNRENIYSEITDLKIQTASIREKGVAIEKSILSINQEIEETIILEEQKKHEIENNVHINEDLEKNIEDFKRTIDSLEIKKSNIKEQLEEIKVERKERLDKSLEIENQLKNINSMIKDLSESLHKLEMQKTKLEVEEENIHNRLWEDYNITFSKALEIRQKVENTHQTQKEINYLKTKIAELGDVNVNAIEEFKTLNERFTFIIAQRNDLMEAKESLTKVIEDIEFTMKKQFIEQMSIINEKFGDVFKKLFGGGKAELLILDGDNVLESGIDIVAQPPGKKLQNLSLLSGGERALTAISLLFAILLVKPSPFCILDEIEAALDDANVQRYGDFLRELSSTTQFIVVTHRKGTMESADALYGVTMEQQGVSKLISVKLSDNEHLK